MRAIEVTRFGASEVLELADLPTPEPAAGELLVRVAFAGVNYRDLLQRKGVFGATPPFIPGTEGAGRVLAVGDGVDDFAVGDRVAWKLGPSYAELVCVSARECVHVPDAVTDELAAACCLQGLTAHFLTSSSFLGGAGASVLVHAASGGVGGLVVSMAKLRGATVIGAVSSGEKVDRARTAGADEVLVYGTGETIDTDALVDRVREYTGGHGVDVVYDGVGRSTFDASLLSCRTRGTLVLYGASSGGVPPFDIMRLMVNGSIVLTRPSVRDFTAEREELDARAEELFSWIVSGDLEVAVTNTAPLHLARDSHDLLESRLSTGKLLLSL